MSMDNFVQSASFPILLSNLESLNLAEFCSTSTDFCKKPILLKTFDSILGMFYHDSLYTQRFQTLVILLFDGGKILGKI